MNRVVIPTGDGVQLEAIVDQPDDATRAFLVCHPHPEQGGTMTHPLIATVADRIVDEGHAAVRFNFRGVGESTGVHSGGAPEIHDIASVMAYMAEHTAPIAGITGWSFGAAVSLGWQAETGSTLPYVGIAPPVDSPLTPSLPDPTALMPAKRTFVVGNRDQFVDADELEDYGSSIDASTIRYDTADHFFIFRHDRLAADVLTALTTSPTF